MRDQPIWATDEQSTIQCGIDSTVQLYVRLENIAALSELRLHRLGLISQCTDTEQFRFNLLHDDCQKDIRAIDAGIRELLKREPSRGCVDCYSLDKIAGWAQYARHPEIPITLEIYFDNNLEVQVVADRYRRDLEAANFGSGHHGFEFAPSRELFFSSEVIEVKAPSGNVIGTYRRKQKSARAA
jgi:hypothetical protein